MASKTAIRIGLVGCGRAGWGMHRPELESRRDKFTVVAACDLEADRRAKMAATYGCRTYRDITALIADPEVELVDLATRSCDHFAHACLALEAGKLVQIEKPMCLTADQARTLQRKARGRLYVRHNRRFEPTFQHIREIIASGVLGKIYQIKLHRGGFQRRDDWQTIKRFGGGQLLNWGPHIVDHALQFLGTPPVQQWSDLKQVAAAGDAEDHLHIVLKNAAGLVVDLEISGGRIIAEPEYIVAGTRGGLQASGDSIRMKYLDPDAPLANRRAQRQTPPQEGGFGNPEKLSWIEKEFKAAPASACTMDGIWDHLYLAIRENQPFPVKLAEAVAVMKVIDAAKQGTRFAP